MWHAIRHPKVRMVVDYSVQFAGGGSPEDERHDLPLPVFWSPSHLPATLPATSPNRSPTSPLVTSPAASPAVSAITGAHGVGVGSGAVRGERGGGGRLYRFARGRPRYLSQQRRRHQSSAVGEGAEGGGGSGGRESSESITGDAGGGSSAVGEDREDSRDGEISLPNIEDVNSTPQIQDNCVPWYVFMS